MYRPNWIVDKHDEKKWADWKAAHPKWELRAAEIGASEDVLRAWVIGATSYVPGVGVFADWDHLPLEREIGEFAKTGDTEMPFGIGILFLTEDRLVLSLWGDDGVQAWKTTPAFVDGKLVGYQAAELLKEAWYLKATEVLDSCRKANIPLAELYASEIKALGRAVSADITGYMMKCGLLPVAFAFTPNYVDVQGVSAYANCGVTVTVDDTRQVPVTWPSGKGGEIPMLNTWGEKKVEG